MSVAWKVDRDQYVKKKQDAFLKKKEEEFDKEQEKFQKHMKKYTEGEKSDDEEDDDIEEPEEYFGEKEKESKSSLDELFDGEEKEESDDEKDDADADEDNQDDDVEEGDESDEEDQDDDISVGEEDADEQMEDAEKPEGEEESKEKKEQTAADFKKTVFVQNLPFQAGVDEIKAIFEKHYGLVAYVAIVAKTDGLSSGKAFVKFKRFKDAKKCIREAEGNLIEKQPEKKKASEKISKEPEEEEERNVGEVLLDGRKLLIARAISKQSSQEINKKKEKKDDPRNLRLAKIGFIAANSPEAKDMPAEHLKKIQKNWAEKNTKLNNPIYHISPTRLAIQNLPKSWTDKDLKNLVLDKIKYDEALGKGKKPKLIQVKIAKDKDSKQSKGFGFVEFEKHEAALCALERLNNNPKILNPRVKDNKVASAARLIVEFAVENTMKLTILRRHQTNSHREKDDSNMISEFIKNRYDQSSSSSAGSSRPPSRGGNYNRNNDRNQKRQRGGNDNKRKRQDNNFRGAKKTKK